MIVVPRVDLHAAVPATGHEDALRSWNGYVEVAPAETARRPDLRLAPGAPVDPREFMAEHGHVGPVRTVGCHFLRNVHVSGMLYAFWEGQLVDDGTHLALVSAEWLRTSPTHMPNQTGKPPLLIDVPILLVGGPGHRTYGHWIIDFLPRIALARDALGAQFRTLKYLILHDTPDWAMRLLDMFFGIKEADCYRMACGHDEVVCSRVVHPTYASTYPFLIHSFLRRFYRGAYPPVSSHRRLCVQRRVADGDGRFFLQRDAFEQEARRRGFELVNPLDLTLAEQIATFASARVIVGEYGSALHNSVFSASSTAVGVVNAPGVEQTRLCAAFGQPILYMPSSNRTGAWTLDGAQINSFFDAMGSI